MSSSAYLGSNMTTREPRIITRLLKKALKELSSLEWPSPMKGLQIAQEGILPSAYGVFGFKLLHMSHLSISMILKKGTFKHLRYEDTRGRPEKAVREKRPLVCMRM